MFPKQYAISLGIPALAFLCFVVWYFSWKIKDKYVAIFGIFFWLYTAGKVVQAFHGWPRIIRWYLSDVGWVPMWGFVGIVVSLSLPHASVNLTIRITRYSIVSAMAVATLFELITAWAKDELIRQGKATQAVVAGDPIDMLIYIVMYFVSFYLLKKSVPGLRQWFE